MAKLFFSIVGMGKIERMRQKCFQTYVRNRRFENGIIKSKNVNFQIVLQIQLAMEIIAIFIWQNLKPFLYGKMAI